LRLLDELRRELSVAILLISHDLSSLAGIADRVVVLYRGRVVEEGPIEQVFTAPKHPYTALLVASAPSLRRERDLSATQLRVPGSTGWSEEACGFASRCRFATAVCASQPALVAAEPDQAIDQPDRATDQPDRSVACHHHDTWRESLLTSSSV
jgi:oligopeptide/dipeptide ABC transporter ATP-binding protein